MVRDQNLVQASNAPRRGALVVLTALVIVGLLLRLPSPRDTQASSDAVESLSGGSMHVLKVHVDDPRVHVQTMLANNDTGGRQTLANMTSRLSGKGFPEYAAINADYFSFDCPSGVNCAEGLTYINGNNIPPWSAYGSTWPVRGNVGFDASNRPEGAIGDAQSRRQMVISGGPWIVRGGGPPVCSGTYKSGKTTFTTNEQFDGDVRSWCTTTAAVSVIGYSSDRTRLFMGVSTGGMTIIQVAQWLKDRGASDVMKLDGGGSAGMVENGSNILYSSRPIADAIAITVTNATSTTPAPTSIPGTPAPIDSSKWYTVSNANSGKCMAAQSGAASDGTALVQAPCDGSAAQRFQFLPTSNGYYRATSAVNTQKGWDVSGARQDDGTPLQLWGYGGGTNQQFAAFAQSGGYVTLMPRYVNKCIDVPGSSTADGARLQIWSCNGTSAQLFRLTSTSSSTPTGPAGTTYCASEDQFCAFSGTKDVAYGANGTWTWRSAVVGGISCSNNTFGDPVPGTVKACFVKDSQPSRQTVLVDDRDGGFSKYGPSQYWYDSPYGYSGHSFFTYVNGNTIGNFCEWRPNLAGGSYEVQVWVPAYDATSQQAPYIVYYSGGSTTRVVNQNSAYNVWISLGTYTFASGTNLSVRLTDATGEAASSYRRLNCDAVQFIPR